MSEVVGRDCISHILFSRRDLCAEASRTAFVSDVVGAERVPPALLKPKRTLTWVGRQRIRLIKKRNGTKALDGWIYGQHGEMHGAKQAKGWEVDIGMSDEL